jgi:hypothetical protein
MLVSGAGRAHAEASALARPTGPGHSAPAATVGLGTATAPGVPGAASGTAAVKAASPAAAPAAAEAPDPEAPTVTARVEPAHAHVGDPLQLTITTIARAGVPVNLPNVLELGHFSLLERTESQTDLGDGRIRRQFVLRVAAYEPGQATIPAIEVTYLGRGGSVREARTTPQIVTITSLIANEPEPALKENAAPVAVLKEDLTLLYVAGALAAGALGGLLTWLVVRRLRRRVQVRPGPPPRPAHEIAMERLDRLGTYGFLENADNRPFYFSISEIIRDYLGARFGFDSLELTTDELLTELRRRAGREVVLGEIKAWLAACDLVKFAKVSPTAAEARGTLEAAIRIVESTRPRPAAPEAPGADSGRAPAELKPAATAAVTVEPTRGPRGN